MSISEDIRHLIEQRDFDTLFNGRHSHKHVKKVDFFDPSPTEDLFKNRHVIYISRELPSKNDPDLICLFPQIADRKKQVLDAKKYFYLSSFNRDINENMKQPPEDSLKPVFAVAYGNHVYVCKFITGTVYIYWTKYINQINAGNVANTPYRRVPLVMNYDGHYGVKGIYILKPQVKHENDLLRIPVAPKNPLIMQDGPMLECETQTMERHLQRLVTVTKREAIQMSTYQTKNAKTWLPYEENVFSNGKNKKQGQGFVIEEEGDDLSSWDLETTTAHRKGVMIMTKESIDHSMGFEEEETEYQERDPFDNTNRIEEEEEKDKDQDGINSSLKDEVLIL